LIYKHLFSYWLFRHIPLTRFQHFNSTTVTL